MDMKPKDVSLETLEREYRCNICGGRLKRMFRFDEEKGAVVRWVECGRCTNRNPKHFIHEIRREKEIAEAREVLDGLDDQWVVRLR